MTYLLTTGNIARYLLKSLKRLNVCIAINMLESNNKEKVVWKIVKKEIEKNIIQKN
jgi:hypothetical protein